MPTPMVASSRGSRGSGAAKFIVVKPGETLNSIAHSMAQGSFRVTQHRQAKAILVQNNQITETTPLQPGQVLNVSEDVGTSQPTDWPGINILHGFSSDVRDLIATSSSDVPPMVALANQADGAGWDVGIDAITAGNYLVLGADSGLAAGGHMLERIRVLGSKIVEEVSAKFGKEVLLSKQPAKLKVVQRYLQNSAKYQELQGLIRTLPKQLKSGLGNRLMPTPGIQAADARWARRLALVEEKGAARYFRSAGSLLEGKISRIGAFGRGTTFVLPAAIGLYNIAKASPSERFKVTIEESVGIGLGAYGTELGLLGGSIVVGVLGLTGVGAFLLLFLAAGAGAYMLSEAGKAGVRQLGSLLD